MEDQQQQKVGANDVHRETDGIQNGAPLVFLREESLFGGRKPHYTEYLKHDEMFRCIAKVIDKTHITGLQRVNGLWRIYLDNLADKAKLITEGVNIRGHILPILQTNPFRPDYENTTRIRVQNVPLSVDDGMITRAFVLMDLDVITCIREKLRIDGKLTNCDTGDRIVTVKTSTLKEPLNRFMYIGKYKVKVIHKNQNKNTKVPKCSKCLETGHTVSACANDWVCILCKQPGHKKGNCPTTSDAHEMTASDASSASETEEDEQDDSSMQTTPSQSGDTELDGHVSARDRTSTKSSRPSVKKTRAPSSKQDSKTAKSKEEKPKGQSNLDKFVQSARVTPSGKDRSRSVTRSPPTPSETLQDTAKKSRKDRRRDDENA